MKKQEVETAINLLGEIKAISDKQEYIVSAPINERYTKIISILSNELKRMSEEKIEVRAPKIMLFESPKDKTLTDTLNKQLEQLVAEDFKIIDFGIMEIKGVDTAFIKYTS